MKAVGLEYLYQQCVNSECGVYKISRGVNIGTYLVVEVPNRRFGTSVVVVNSGRNLYTCRGTKEEIRYLQYSGSCEYW
jgi:hypothetical protein